MRSCYGQLMKGSGAVAYVCLCRKSSTLLSYQFCNGF